MSAEALVKRIATESRACALNYTVVATSGSAGLITKPWDVARALEVAAFYALPRYLITEAAVKVFASQVFTCQFPINKLSKIIYTMCMSAKPECFEGFKVQMQSSSICASTTFREGSIDELYRIW